MSAKGEQAKALFLEGYNCAQAVFVVFAEDYGISREAALKLSSSFGGGFGRLREVCGAVCGMTMALGLAEGNTDTAGKLAHYEKVRALMGEFSNRHGGYVCRDLIATGDHHNCAEFVYSAAEILENYLAESKK
ncbi:MAG: C_GCAxxG_C_C family protein [Clostridia bacterium]|nr:C_GCAxxG_C_C family protein [Clostridia bacterium]